MSAQSSPSGLLVSLLGLGIFGYSAYYINYNPNVPKMQNLLPPQLRVFGQLKFLTYHSLCFQLLSAALHVAAHFVRALEKPRDLVFAGLAYPVGSVVVYSFWGVWLTMGREFIFPAAMDEFYPPWLNHATHSLIAPLNIILAFLIDHKYTGASQAVCLFYFAFYTALLHYIKFKSGFFVYKYLDTMSQGELVIYFAATGLFAFLIYKSGQYLSSLFHKRPTQRPIMKKTKQK